MCGVIAQSYASKQAECGFNNNLALWNMYFNHYMMTAVGLFVLCGTIELFLWASCIMKSRPFPLFCLKKNPSLHDGQGKAAILEFITWLQSKIRWPEFWGNCKCFLDLSMISSTQGHRDFVFVDSWKNWNNLWYSVFAMTWALCFSATISQTLEYSPPLDAHSWPGIPWTLNHS